METKGDDFQMMIPIAKHDCEVERKVIGIGTSNRVGTIMYECTFCHHTWSEDSVIQKRMWGYLWR